MANNIPRALRTDLVDDGLGQSQFVETRVIQPVNGWNGGSQGQIRFILPKQGILDKAAYIQLQLQAGNAAHRLPQVAGIFSTIETATLYCGGIQICQSRGVGHLTTLKQFYRTPHDRDNKQAIRVGCFEGKMVDATYTNGTPGGMPDNKPGHWGVDTVPPWADAIDIDTRAWNNGYKLTTDPNTTPEWRIYLEDLFPILYSNNLPLGLIQDEFSIVLDLGEDLARGQRTVIEQGTDWNVAEPSFVIRPSLHIDLIFYDDPIDEPSTMDKLAAVLDKGQKLVFTDHTYVLNSMPAVGADGNQNIQVLLGVNHQIVRNILMASPFSVDYTTPDNNTNGDPLLGQYYSVGSRCAEPAAPQAGAFPAPRLPGQTLQLTINSQPVYPNALNTDAKIWNELSQVYPTPFKCNSAYTSWVGQSTDAGAVDVMRMRITNRLLNGWRQCLSAGNCHYYGINLSRTYENVMGAGTAIGRQPVILELTEERYDGAAQGFPSARGAKTLHIWASCERLLQVQNGKVAVSGS